MSSSRALPSWIEVTRGSAPILLLAPHGGRRLDVRVPGKHKVNDLRTAEVTRSLAAVLGAGTIINEQVDRNALDLNRSSQVRRDAPWLIDLLAEMLTDLITRFGRATVLVIHGWNVGQIACDVGIGMREEADGLAPCRPGSATARSAFVSERLRPLQSVAAGHGITVTIGCRYPAAHPNNLLQIFRGTDDAEAEGACPIATLCRTAVVDAAQLELAIPLRWPGARRDRFVALLGEVFRAETSKEARVVHARRGDDLRAIRGRITRRRGLQLVMDDLLLMTGIDAGEHGVVGGRVVLSEAADRLSLFTGELADPAVEWAVPPLFYEETTGMWRFTYEGPLVTFSSHTPFLDLERGLAGGAVVEGGLDLLFAPDRKSASVEGDECFGDVRGEVHLAGRRHRIEARGLATRTEAPARSQFPHCRVTLVIGPSMSCTLTTRPGDTTEWANGRLRATLVGTVYGGDEAVAVEVAGEVRIGVDAGSFVLDGLSGWPSCLEGSLERLLPVRRPGPLELVIETTFALMRIDGRSVGWLEVTVLRETLDASPGEVSA